MCLVNGKIYFKKCRLCVPIRRLFACRGSDSLRFLVIDIPVYPNCPNTGRKRRWGGGEERRRGEEKTGREMRGEERRGEEKRGEERGA